MPQTILITYLSEEFPLAFSSITLKDRAYNIFFLGVIYQNSMLIKCKKLIAVLNL